MDRAAHRGRWIGGIVIVALIAFVTWLGVREIPEERLGIEGIVVSVLAPPTHAVAGEPVPVEWMVRAPVGAATEHTAIHWGLTSNSGPLSVDVAPDSLAYSELLSDYASGSFALPRNFAGVMTFPDDGTYYYRAHAIIDGLQYWSSEYGVVVE